MQQAEHLYRQIISTDPDNAEANHYLGILEFQYGKNKSAVQYFNRAIQSNPNIPPLYSNLGNAYKRLRLFDDAVASYKKAISLRPDSAEMRINLGATLWEMACIDEAIASYKKAISLKPDFAEAHCNLGLLYKESGQLNEAIASYHRAISFKPDYAKAHRYLSFAIRHDEYDDTIRAMETVYARTDNTTEQKMHLAFGLGKAYEDLKDYDKSFSFILEGNRLKRASFQYSIDEDRDSFAQLKKVFSSAFLADHSNKGNPDETPIFILGLPRSGTTLVEQILASHSEVYGAGELNDLSYITRALSSESAEQDFPECVSDLNENELIKLGSDYLEKIRNYSASANYVTDKMPNNFKMIGFIRMILPGAKVVHCMRDPMDNCLSIFKNYFSGTHKYAYDMTEIGQYYKLYLDLMNHWQKTIPGFIYNVRYEALVSEQEEQTRKLLAYCKLPWDKNCLSFHKTKRVIATASTIDVRRPIYSDSIQLWKKYETHLEPLRRILFE